MQDTSSTGCKGHSKDSKSSVDPKGLPRGEGKRVQPWLGKHTGSNSEGKIRITALLPSLRFSECFFFQLKKKTLIFTFNYHHSLKNVFGCNQFSHGTFMIT